MENISKISGELGLIQNVPKEILNKFNIINKNKQSSETSTEVVIISGDTVDNITSFVNNLGGSYEDLGYGFGVVNIVIEAIPSLLANTKIIYVELPLSLITTDLGTNRETCVNQAQTTFGLDGSGMLIGFIDSGIDFTHPAFRNEDGNTRVEYIYDLSGNGKVYNRITIDQALKSQDPFSIVPVEDLTEHGTHVAGIACAGGKIPRENYGVAPKSSIIMVRSTRGRFSLSTQIMRGIKFLVDKSKELSRPIAINISLSTNDGAHNGSSLLEEYIKSVTSIEKVTMCVAAGNEGDTAHHIHGDLNGENIININVAEGEPSVILNLYKSVLPDITIEIINPSGKSSGNIEVKQGYNEGALGQDRFIIYSTGPKPFDIAGEIVIGFTTNKAYITAGRWRVVIRLQNKYTGRYDMWLPVAESLNINTKFLNPSVLNTLGIPATVDSVISVGSYNYLTNTVSSFSGRGKGGAGKETKPDIIAPGEDINSTVPNRRFGVKSGTSMATPQVTGIVALMMEWGIVKGNDPYMFGERLKYYLVQGAKRTRLDEKYPSPSLGYGEVCINNSLELASETINSIRGDKEINKKNMDRDDFIEEESISAIIEVDSEESYREIIALPGVNGLILGLPFALVIFPKSQLSEIESRATSVVKYSIPSIYTLNSISPTEGSGAPVFINNPYLNLNGRGVIVGIMDTGIDYLNEEFLREDNTSRVLRLWDQTLEPTKTVVGVKFGQEFTNEQINEAIKLKSTGGDPYSIVPSKDENGHGTMVAGVVGGRGVNPDLIGAAPDCEFISVKLIQASEAELNASMIESKVPSYAFTALYLGIRYIVNIANQLKKPVVIYIPLGTNIGPHDGKSVLEGYIEALTRQVGTVFITSTGNEGDTETHAEGVFTSVGDIKELEIKVGEFQKKLPLQIWVNKPNIVSLSIISPSGEIVENLISKLTKEKTIKFVYEGTTMIVNYKEPEFVTGDTLISIKMSNLKRGIWRFRLKCEKLVDGRYYAWIPQRVLLEPDTKFLSPSEFTTLTMPGTTDGIITVASYNQNNNATVSFSGRGFNRQEFIKPDIAAGGISALVIKPGGGSMVANGSSISGAVVAGCSALLLQWGIVDGNNRDLYTTTIKSYIITGARERAGDMYPNEEWGYGVIDMEGIFEFIRGGTREFKRQPINYDEYKVNELLIRKPKEL